MRHQCVRVSAFVLALAAGLWVAGCDQAAPNAIEQTSDASELAITELAKNAAKGPAGYDGYAGTSSGEFVLWAGKTHNAGVVTVTNDSVNFYVEFNTNGTADLKEVHVYVWTDEGSIPSKRPAPGKAPFKVDGLYADSYTVTVPRSEYQTDIVYIAAHAALTADAPGDDEGDDLLGSNAGESAYAGGDAVPEGFPKGKGAWWGYVSYEAQDAEVLYSISGTLGVNGECSPDYFELTLWHEGEPTSILAYGNSYEFSGLPEGSYELEVYAIFTIGTTPTSFDVDDFDIELSGNTEYNFTVDCPVEPPPPPPPFPPSPSPM